MRPWLAFMLTAVSGRHGRVSLPAGGRGESRRREVTLDEGDQPYESQCQYAAVLLGRFPN